MGSKKNDQHIVPRTYLKHWCMPGEGSFVCVVDFGDKYNTNVQVVGVNDKMFKRKRYYNDPSFANPFIIEDMLGEDFEPTYEVIMNEVKSEQELSQDVRAKIIGWLFTSKARSPYMRDNTERVAQFVLKTQERLITQSALTAEREQELESIAKETAKRVHLRQFTKEHEVKEMLTLYVETLANKHWRILKASPLLEFWTNDNPGFSPNMEERFHEAFGHFHPVMELNAHSIVFFPLSPKYCLEISPFEAGTPLEISALSMSIKYEEVPVAYVDYINRGVFSTKHRIVVANNKEILQRCIK